MWTKAFWKDVAERSLKTFAQFMVTLGGFATVVSPDQLTTVNWPQILVISLVGAGASVLTSLASSFKGDPKSASLVE